MYDKEKIVDEQVAPHIEAIYDICQKNGVEFVINLLIRETEQKGKVYSLTSIITRGDTACAAMRQIMDSYEENKYEREEVVQ